MITDTQALVLEHTSQNGRYVTSDPAVIAMAEAGWLYDHGPQTLAGGDHYLVTTMKGRTALSEWRAAQPPPPPPPRARRCSEQFKSWRAYCENCRRLPFTEFLRDVWPIA